jgi:hypothetical protein
MSGPGTDARTPLLAAVEFVVGDEEVFEDAPVYDGFLDNAGNVGDLHAAVPDGLRIDDDRRAELALVEAAGGVGANLRLEIAALELLLEGAPQLLVAVRIATAPAAVFVALVDSDEDVVGEGGHALL